MKKLCMSVHQMSSIIFWWQVVKKTATELSMILFLERTGTLFSRNTIFVLTVFQV